MCWPVGYWHCCVCEGVWNVTKHHVYHLLALCWFCLKVITQWLGFAGSSLSYMITIFCRCCWWWCFACTSFFTVGVCEADGDCSQEPGQSVLLKAVPQTHAAEKQSSIPLWQQCADFGMLTSPFHSAKTVTVLSYNIWNFNAEDNDYVRRVQRIGKVLDHTACPRVIMSLHRAFRWLLVVMSATCKGTRKKHHAVW